MPTIERFPIRVMPKVGESLSSYLLRLLSRNVADFNRTFETLNVRYSSIKKGVMGYARRIDILPRRIVDMRLLSDMTGLDVRELESMTFTAVFDKLFDDPDQEQVRKWLHGVTDKSNRRYCPLCIKEFGYYKLLWQVTDIKICDIHKVALESKCSICSKKQPYLSNYTARHECVNGCGRLYNCPPVADTNEQFIEAQMQKYDEWNWLVHPDTRLVTESVEGFDRFKSILLTLLYITEGNQTLRRGKNRFLVNEQIDNLRRIILDKPGVNQSIMLRWLLSTLERAQFKISKFPDIQISHSFIESVLKESLEQEKNPNEICLAPWCSAFGTNRNIQRVSHVSHMHYKDVLYVKHSVCTECYMHFGEDSHDGIWKSIGGMTDITERVREFLCDGLVKTAIHQKLGVSRRVIDKVIGYLACRRLLPENVAGIYTTLHIPENIVSCFKELAVQKGNMPNNANRMFGWKPVQFYYYSALRSVQEYLVFELHDIRGKSMKGNSNAKRVDVETLKQAVDTVIVELVEKEIEISLESVAVAVDCTVSKLRLYGVARSVSHARLLQKERLIRGKVEKVIGEIELGTTYNVESALVAIGVSREPLRQMLPDVWQRLRTVIESDKEAKRQETIEAYKAQAKEIISGMREVGYIGASVQTILKDMGVSPTTVRRYYPEVIEYIKATNKFV